MYFLFFKKLFIYLFVYLLLAALGLCCCVRAFCSCCERGLLFVAVRGLLIAVASRHRARALGAQASVVVARGLSSCGSRALECGLSSCGARPWLLRGMWDLRGPGLKPVSPALAGRFLTTAPPGKSYILDINPYQIQGLQIFSPSFRLPFHSIVSLLCKSFLVWCNLICLCLLSLPVLLASYPRNHCPDQCQEAFLLCFHLVVLLFQVLRLRTWFNTIDVNLDQLAEIAFVKFLHCEVILSPSFSYCIFGKEVHWLAHLRSDELCSNFLKLEYLDELFEIVSAQEICLLLLVSPFPPFTYLYHYFILWVYNPYYFIFFVVHIILALAFGSSFSWLFVLLTFLIIVLLSENVPYFLELQDAPGPSYIFSTPVLESAISPKSPGSFFYWRMVLGLKIWALGVLVYTGALLLLGFLSWQRKDIYVCILTCVYTRINK